MKRVRADFVEASLPSQAIWLLLIALFLGVIYAATAARDDISAITQRAQAKVEQQRKAEQEVLQRHATRSALDDRAAELRQLRMVPWPEVLTSLETVPKDAITIDSIAIDVAGGMVRCDVTSKDAKAIGEFVTNLNAGVSPNDAAWLWSVVRIGAGREQVFSAEVVAKRQAKRP
jgi:hypothetical protein